MSQRWEYTRAQMMSSQDENDWLSTKIWWQVDLTATDGQFGNGELARVVFPMTTFNTFEDLLAMLGPLGWDLVSHIVVSYEARPRRRLREDGSYTPDDPPQYYLDANCIEYIFRRPYRDPDQLDPR